MPSSGYTLWNVVAGEQPTSAKWNILGNNDASFNSGAGFNDSLITNRHIAVNAVASGIKTTAGEITYTDSTWVAVNGMSTSITTTKPSQFVVVLSTVQTFSGGYTQWQYQLDGSFVGNPSKYQTGVNNSTTGAFTFIDYFTISTTGSHTINLMAYSGGGLRIIHGEGTGRMVALLA